MQLRQRLGEGRSGLLPQPHIHPGPSAPPRCGAPASPHPHARSSLPPTAAVGRGVGPDPKQQEGMGVILDGQLASYEYKNIPITCAELAWLSNREDMKEGKPYSKKPVPLVLSCIYKWIL